MRRWRLARCVLWAVLLSSIAAGELAAQNVASPPTPTPAPAAATPTAAATVPTPAATAEASPAQAAASPTVTTPAPSPTASPQVTADDASGTSAGSDAVSLVDAIAGAFALLMATAARALVFLVLVGVVAAFAYATYRILLRFLRELDRRLTIGARSHWGGFGGGESGWDVSPALALLVAALVLAIATAGLGGTIVRSALDWGQSDLEAAKKSASDAPAGEKGAGAGDKGGKAGSGGSAGK